ncbi:hypothetical protein [Actinoplanes sp. NPDC049265]|uniref:hypothetical protein n=1 Tax=Actinoplanes sp. NPDC049265 TaxID=3363902 RepID=UPI003713C2B8
MISDAAVPAQPRRIGRVTTSCLLLLAELAWLAVAGLYSLSVVILGHDEVRQGELGVGEWAVGLGAVAVVLATGLTGLVLTVVSAFRTGSRWLVRVIAGLLVTGVGVVTGLVYLLWH